MKRLFLIIPCALLAITTSASARMDDSVAYSNSAPIRTNETIIFPDIEKSYLDDFPRYDPVALTHITKGIDDDTVRQLVGNPHFNEFMSNKWNYVFQIRQPYSTNYIQCQLQLHFDKDNKVEDYYWHNSQCSDAIEAALQPPKPTIIEKRVEVPVASVITEPKVRTFNLSSDFLFDFDSAQLKPSSAIDIDNIVATLKRDYRQIHSIKVVGHTDRLGSEIYNHALALKRANTVRNELISKGFDPSIMSVSSMGEASPVTTGCLNMSREQTKACLKPDRRVELQVVGTLR